MPFRRLGVAALVESTRRAIRRAKNSSFQRRVRRRQNIRHGLEELIRVTVFHTIEEHDVSIHGRHRVRAVGEPLGAVTHRLDGVRAVQIKRQIRLLGIFHHLRPSRPRGVLQTLTNKVRKDVSLERGLHVRRPGLTRLVGPCAHQLHRQTGVDSLVRSSETDVDVATALVRIERFCDAKRRPDLRRATLERRHRFWFLRRRKRRRARLHDARLFRRDFLQSIP